MHDHSPDKPHPAHARSDGSARADETPPASTQATADAALLKRLRMEPSLSEAIGGFHLTDWDTERRLLSAAFTVRPEYCHSRGQIAQGGFITGWLDAAMAYAVMMETQGRQAVFSLELKVSFFEKVGPGPGRVQARVLRRGKRVAFLEGWLYNSQGQLAAQASSTGVLAERITDEPSGA